MSDERPSDGVFLADTEPLSQDGSRRGIVISLDEHREKKTPQDRLRELVREAVEEHVAASHVAERERLVRQVDELSEIVQSYQKTEADRAQIHREALRQAEARVTEVKEHVAEMKTQIRRIIALAREHGVDTAKMLAILVGEDEQT